MQAWVSCSVGRTTACDPHTLVGAASPRPQVQRNKKQTEKPIGGARDQRGINRAREGQSVGGVCIRASSRERHGVAVSCWISAPRPSEMELGTLDKTRVRW